MLGLFFAEYIAYGNMFFEKENGVKELAVGTLSELPTDTFLHVDGKDVEINHFTTFCTGDQLHRVGSYG
jgi:hypothetical protein